jgi:hypothetical protein
MAQYYEETVTPFQLHFLRLGQREISGLPSLHGHSVTVLHQSPHHPLVRYLCHGESLQMVAGLNHLPGRYQTRNTR